MSLFGSLKKLVKKAVKVAGLPLHATVEGIAHIPVVGKPFSAVLSLTIMPVSVSESIVNGKRIDRVAYDSFKATIKDIRTVGPYAQAVISMVPGIGTGVSAGIAGGLALANGKRIDEALQASVAGALPGGPLAKTAFNITVNGIQGEKISLDAIEIPGVDKKTLSHVISSTRKLLKGERIDHIALDEALKELPPETRAAVQVGISVGNAALIQRDMGKAGKTLAKELAKEGKKRLLKSEVLTAAKNNVPGGELGFSAGIELMNRSGVTAHAVYSVRNAMKPKERKGFDAAMALHVGAVLTPKAPPTKNPHITAAHYIAVGTAKIPPSLPSAQHRLSWWNRLLNFLGL